MSEFSSEDIQQAADEVRRGGFGDFMFRDPGHNRGTSRRRTSRQRTSGHRTSGSRVTSRKNTSRKNTTRRVTSRRRITTRRNDFNCSGWKNSTRGNSQMNSCWKDGNMWELRIRSR